MTQPAPHRMQVLPRPRARTERRSAVLPEAPHDLDRVAPWRPHTSSGFAFSSHAIVIAREHEREPQLLVRHLARLERRQVQGPTVNSRTSRSPWRRAFFTASSRPTAARSASRSAAPPSGSRASIAAGGALSASSTRRREAERDRLRGPTAAHTSLARRAGSSRPPRRAGVDRRQLRRRGDSRAPGSPPRRGLAPDRGDAWGRSRRTRGSPRSWSSQPRRFRIASDSAGNTSTPVIAFTRSARKCHALLQCPLVYVPARRYFAPGDSSSVTGRAAEDRHSTSLGSTPRSKRCGLRVHAVTARGAADGCGSDRRTRRGRPPTGR